MLWVNPTVTNYCKESWAWKENTGNLVCDWSLQRESHCSAIYVVLDPKYTGGGGL